MSGIEKEELRQVINFINSRIVQLNGSTPIIKTAGHSFKYVPTQTGGYDFRNQYDLRTLLSIKGFITTKMLEYNDAADSSGLRQGDFPEFTWCDFSGEDWLHDINQWINKVTNAQEVTRLQADRSELIKMLQSLDRLNEIKIILERNKEQVS